MLLRRVLEGGGSIGLAVDGPKGPYGQIRDGDAEGLWGPVSINTALLAYPTVVGTFRIKFDQKSRSTGRRSGGPHRASGLSARGTSGRVHPTMLMPGQGRGSWETRRADVQKRI